MQELKPLPPLTEDESLAMQTLAKCKFNPDKAVRRLAELGLKTNPSELDSIQRTHQAQVAAIARQAEAQNRILSSLERVIEEFDEHYERVNKAAKYFEDKQEYVKMLQATQLAFNALTVALKKHGVLNEMQTKFSARTINILGTPEISTALRSMLETWFKRMDAEYTGGKFIFHNPSPELVDDFKRWQTKQAQDAKVVEASVKN